MTFPYSFRVMEGHVRQLVRQHNMTGFNWNGAGNAPDGMRDVLFDYYPNGQLERLVTLAGGGSATARRELVACEIAVYCYVCYQAAFSAQGDQVIGREADIGRAGLYARLGNMIVNQLGIATNTLFDAGTRGNVLKMDKWATMVNDAWLLGGMHRGADFQLRSVKTLANLWNQQGGYLIVTAREILGLCEFGYAPQPQPPGQPARFTRQTWQARFINLVDYDAFIEQPSIKGKAFAHAIPATVAPQIIQWQRGRNFNPVLAGIRTAAGRTNHGNRLLAGVRAAAGRTNHGL